MSEVCKHEAIDERGRCECGAVLLHQPNAGNRPSKPSRVRELADHIQNNDDACSVCWEAASALSAYAAILDEPDQLYALLVKRGWSQQDADQIAQGRVPSEARGPFPDGDWLWGKLMDWCREHGAHPANYNDLFAIVDEARKARAANEPLTGIESLSGGNPGEKSACLPADNRGIAEAGSNPATHPDPKSGMSGAPGSGQHPDDDEESTRDCAERRSPAGTERTPAPDESNRHAPPPPDVQREVEMWRQVWDNVKLDVHNLREDNKPLAVAAAYALARADAERYRWLRERINWRDTVETSGELSCRYRIWEHRDYRRTYPKSETIDEAIDAARAAAAKGDDRG